jgi:CO/xanthine dehydrogenase Mo-binding subunit
MAVRASIASGSILSVQIPRLPPKYSVVHAEDIPGENRYSLDEAEMPFLAETEVSYKGEPILLMAGPNQEALKRFAERVSINYQSRKPALSLLKGTLGETVEIEKGSCARAMNGAEKIITGEYSFGGQKYSHPQIHRALAFWEDRTLVVAVATDYPFHTRAFIASLLGLAPKRIHVRVDPTPHCGSDIVNPTIVGAQAALLAFILKRPIQIEPGWLESTRFSPQRHPFFIRYRTGLNSHGNIVALEAQLDVDTGAYGLMGYQTLERALLAICGGYACENLSLKARSYRTNRAPYYSVPSAGEVQASFACEVHATKIASALEMVPNVWKKNNLVESTVPLSVAGRTRIGDAPLRVLDDVVERSDYTRKYGAYEAGKKRRSHIFESQTPLRGIGLSLCFHGTGELGRYEKKLSSTVKVQLGTKQKVRILTSITDAQSRMLYRTLASEILNVPLSEVITEAVDTSLVPDSGVSTPSRGRTLVAWVVVDCCRRLVRKRLKEAPPISITRSYRVPESLLWSPENLSADPYPALSWEATVVEIELDPVTLIPAFKGIWVSLEGASALTRNVDRTMAEGAVLLDLGSSAVFVEEGDTRIHYPVLSATEIPGIEINFVEGKTDSRSEGSVPGDELEISKGLGDQAVTGFPAAYVLAVSQASGYAYSQVPLTPEVIHENLRS